MAATDVISTSLERNWGMVDRALEGLDSMRAGDRLKVLEIDSE